MPLFVVLRDRVELDDALKTKIKASIRKNLSPHHVPDEILAIEEVPRTLNGKKTEVPVKKLFMGVPVEKAVSRDALANPQAIQSFLDYAQQARAASSKVLRRK
jgi:acetoacetyl-CoA synthetase